MADAFPLGLREVVLREWPDQAEAMEANLIDRAAQAHVSLNELAWDDREVSFSGGRRPVVDGAIVVSLLELFCEETRRIEDATEEGTVGAERR
jgi:hypothetical protein